MENLYNRLQHYFNTTPREQVLEDWNSTADFDKIDSPTIPEFIEKTNHFMEIKNSPPRQKSEIVIKENIQNPKLISDFSFCLN